MVLHIAVLCASLTACRIISEYADVSISACSKVGWTSGLEQLPDIQPSGVEQKCLPLGLIGVLPDIRPRQAEQECKLVWVQMDIKSNQKSNLKSDTLPRAHRAESGLVSEAHG